MHLFATTSVITEPNAHIWHENRLSLLLRGYKNIQTHVQITELSSHTDTHTYSLKSLCVEPQYIKPNYSVCSACWKGQLHPPAHDSQDGPQTSCCVCTPLFVRRVSKNVHRHDACSRLKISVCLRVCINMFYCL